MGARDFMQPLVEVCSEANQYIERAKISWWLIAYLIWKGNVEKVEEEIENDEDINVKDYYGNTPLHEAVAKGISMHLQFIS